MNFLSLEKEFPFLFSVRHVSLDQSFIHNAAKTTASCYCQNWPIDSDSTVPWFTKGSPISSTSFKINVSYLRIATQFSVTGTQAQIVGGSEVHVEQGSTLNLTCVVRNTREKPHYLLWYHRNQVCLNLVEPSMLNVQQICERQIKAQGLKKENSVLLHVSYTNINFIHVYWRGNFSTSFSPVKNAGKL